jgi:hypothetical protein
MRSKLSLGLASASLLIVAGAVWAASGSTPSTCHPAAADVQTAAIPSAAVPVEPPCCCSAKTAPVCAGLLYCPLTDTVNEECCCIPLTSGK